MSQAQQQIQQQMSELFHKLQWIEYEIRGNAIIGLIIMGFILSYFVVLFVNWLHKKDQIRARMKYERDFGSHSVPLTSSSHQFGTGGGVVENFIHEDSGDDEEEGEGLTMLHDEGTSPREESVVVVESYTKPGENNNNSTTTNNNNGGISDRNGKMSSYYYDDQEEGFTIEERTRFLATKYDTAVFKVLSKTEQKYVPPEGVELSWENPELNTYGLLLKVVMTHDKITMQDTGVPFSNKYHTSVVRKIWESIETPDDDSYVMGHIHKNKNSILVTDILEDFESYAKKVEEECCRYVAMQYHNPYEREEEEEEEEKFKDDEPDEKVSDDDDDDDDDETKKNQ